MRKGESLESFPYNEMVFNTNMSCKSVHLSIESFMFTLLFLNDISDLKIVVLALYRVLPSQNGFPIKCLEYPIGILGSNL